MAGVLKWSARVAAAVLGLALLAIALALLWFNPNRYRVELEQFLSAQLGRAVTIQGELNWHPGAQLVLDIPALQVANPDGFPRTAFLAISSATLRIALRPLLAQQLQLGVLHIDGLQLHLQRDRQGRDNWTDLMQRLNAEGGGDYAFAELAGLVITQGQLTYHDAANQREVQLAALELRLESLKLEQMTPLKLQAQLRIKPDQSHPAWQTALNFSAGVAIGSPPNLVLSQAQLLLQNSGADEGTAARALPPVTLSLSELAWLQDADTLQIDAVQVVSGDASLSADFQVQSLSDVPALRGAGRITVPQLRTLAQQWAMPLPPTRDKNVLQSLSAVLQWQGSAQSGQVTVSPLMLDGTRVEGEFVWNEVSPELQVRLHADRLNLDRYLPTAAASAPPQAVPLQWLQQLKARGSLSIDDAQWQGLRARGLRLELEP